MTVKVGLKVPELSDLPPGVIIWKNGRGFFLTIDEFEKILEEGKELLKELKNLKREVKQLAH